MASVHKTSSIFKTDIAISKLPHFHSSYIVGVCIFLPQLCAETYFNNNPLVIWHLTENVYLGIQISKPSIFESHSCKLRHVEMQISIFHQSFMQDKFRERQLKLELTMQDFSQFQSYMETNISFLSKKINLANCYYILKCRFISFFAGFQRFLKIIIIFYSIFYS